MLTEPCYLIPCFCVFSLLPEIVTQTHSHQAAAVFSEELCSSVLPFSKLFTLLPFSAKLQVPNPRREEDAGSEAARRNTAATRDA